MKTQTAILLILSACGSVPTAPVGSARAPLEADATSTVSLDSSAIVKALCSAPHRDASTTCDAQGCVTESASAGPMTRVCDGDRCVDVCAEACTADTSLSWCGFFRTYCSTDPHDANACARYSDLGVL